MAPGAVKSTMHGLLEGSLVDVSLHAFLTMTGVTIILGNSDSSDGETEHEYCKEGAYHGSNIAKNLCLSR